MTSSRSLPERGVTAAAALALFGTVLIFMPGVAMYDSVAQYAQAVSGVYDDWHPPAMARLWAAFGVHGTWPMFAAQISAYWLGLGTVAAALVRIDRRRSAAAMVAIGLWPPFLGWQVVVLKDTQMVGAMLAATGIVAWWRLRERPLPWVAVASVIVLLGYAVLVRANAVFAVVPLGVWLLPRPKTGLAKAAMTMGAMIVVLASLPLVNHRMLGTRASGVERTEALYDLTGIAVRTNDPALGLSASAIGEIRTRACVKPFFWDPLGDAAHCDGAVNALRAIPVSALYERLVWAILAHPVAYAAHRLAHYNSTERWIVALHWPGAAPPSRSEPNALGLGSPGPIAAYWQRVAGWLVETPLGWPIVWIVIAAAAVGIACSRRTPESDLAVALLGSALTLEASFAVLSIASDLRYHLWPMIATAMAVALLAQIRVPRRWGVGIGMALAVILTGGIFARAVLPVPAQSYAGLLG